jgi:aerobic-type carbon monoxide dehydrogenase small subunit (CoxS/CutS family)
MLIQAADLLATTKNPTKEQIRTAMNGHLCRCGTYLRVEQAVLKAAKVMVKNGSVSA